VPAPPLSTHDGDNTLARPGSRLWERVYQTLVDEIGRGALAPSARLPSERDLSQRLSVSRVTVRRALGELARQGLIETSTGLGWHVRVPEVEEPPDELVSFARMGASLGLAVTSRVLVARTRSATLDEAEALTVAPGAEVVELERLRLLEGVPIVVDYSLIPSSRAPGLLETDFARASLYDTLAERYGIVAYRAEYVVQAQAADERVAKLLDLSPGQPVLVAEQTTVDLTRRPFQLSTLTYRGDRYRFRNTLTMPSVAASRGPVRDGA
jgi:GntR family transcriptional regulator